MTASAYLLGRDIASLQAPFAAEDKLFVATGLDHQTIDPGTFSHCTFANISFKEASLKNTRFIDCVFVGCYFRRTSIEECMFNGCRFFDCDFPHVAIKGCDFRYCKFWRCFIPFGEMELSLPQEPNLRQELSRNLSLAAAGLGFPSEARAYRFCELRSNEEHLKAAVTAASKWYRDHYDPLRRLGALLGLILSILNRLLWGYGERPLILARNFLLIALIIFPLIYYSLRTGIQKSNGDAVSFVDTIYFSLHNILPAGFDSNMGAGTAGVQALSGIESLFAVVTASLFASYLFRWILHR